MKKAILIVAALLMVVSGVAAVSAYEAHIINVTAHVENALDVAITRIEFGTVFPQEVRIDTRSIALSESANLTLGEVEGDLLDVDYTVWAEWKVDDQDPANHTPDVLYGDPEVDYYKWLGAYLWVGVNQADPTLGSTLASQGWSWVGSAPVMPIMAKTTGETGTLTSDTPDTLKVMLLAPCFHGSYNHDTDTKPNWWPAYNPATGDFAEWPLLSGLLKDGCDLGVDLKIQVTDIGRVGPQ